MCCNPTNQLVKFVDGCLHQTCKCLVIEWFAPDQTPIEEVYLRQKLYTKLKTGTGVSLQAGG